MKTNPFTVLTASLLLFHSSQATTLGFEQLMAGQEVNPTLLSSPPGQLGISETYQFGRSNVSEFDPNYIAISSAVFRRGVSFDFYFQVVNRSTSPRTVVGLGLDRLDPNMNIGVGYTVSGTALIPGAPAFFWHALYPDWGMPASFLDGGVAPEGASLVYEGLEEGNSLTFSLTLAPGQHSSVVAITTDSNSYSETGGLRTDYAAGEAWYAAVRPDYYVRVPDTGSTMLFITAVLLPWIILKRPCDSTVHSAQGIDPTGS